ncbi:hypothetical protein CO046_05550 [Candidatus Peregrinibacteria bacterium CG_4_9_14_0_2_um_filter_53_11]|nr:MAG: hypothetical protein CO046_05550 [Candidatus Peregrinibacteria bacterium CG_4_9_14_0_2_um_filter_53_11]
MNKLSKNRGLFVALTLLLVGSLYGCELPPDQGAPSDGGNGQLTPDFSTLVILVPEDRATYEREMAEFVQAGGVDPLTTTTFVEKRVDVPYTEDRLRASAEAAAAEIPPGGGPPHASVAYFKVVGEQAYVLLDIDLDGWAGVSVSRAIIHPLVEKTLLRFPDISGVTFGYAPGDEPS